MSEELLQKAIRLISSSYIVIGCLPASPVYNNGEMIIYADEAARIEQDLKEAISILEAIAQPVQPASEWRDIATAPKSPILLSVDGSVEIGHLGLGGWVHERDYEDMLDLPTHWMPLPAAPKETK